MAWERIPFNGRQELIHGNNKELAPITRMQYYYIFRRLLYYANSSNLGVQLTCHDLHLTLTSKLKLAT